MTDHPPTPNCLRSCWMPPYWKYPNPIFWNDWIGPFPPSWQHWGNTFSSLMVSSFKILWFYKFFQSLKFVKLSTWILLTSLSMFPLHEAIFRFRIVLRKSVTLMWKRYIFVILTLPHNCLVWCLKHWQFSPKALEVQHMTDKPQSWLSM